jgi:hypothetical protein
VRGMSKGARVTVRSCYTNRGGEGRAIAAGPNLGAPVDQFVLVGDKLMWFRRGGATGQWSHYRTLRPVDPKRA